MRLMSACLALLLGIVTARKEILKRQGDYYLRLHNQGGNLVLDEGIEDLPLVASSQWHKISVCLLAC